MSEVKVNKITPTTDCGTVTLGDSGDTVAISAGVTLTSGGALQNSGTITNTGSITGVAITGTIDNQVNWQTTVKTSTFTATAGEGYFCNTTSGAFTVNLPASPSAGDLVGIKDYANTADTNNITIGRNGSNIEGVANNFVISVEGGSITLIYVDATKGWLSTAAAKASDITEQATFITATGGTITQDGDFKVHTFTGPGTFCVTGIANPVGGPNSVDYLVVAGGGGGDNGSSNRAAAGGGGAGGYRTSFPSCNAGSIPVAIQGYSITVGGGGAGGSAVNGSPSIFSTITSAGGGYGFGGDNIPGPAGGPGGGPGGSGGGGDYGSPSAPNPGQGGTGNTPPVSPPQGNPGGNGNYGPSPEGPASTYPAGGGGGAAAAGGDGPAPGSPVIGGAGGAGAPNAITGSATFYAGGGGGGTSRAAPDTHPNPDPQGTGGPGGNGGGGDGSGGGAGAAAQAGTANTGGGGGGGTAGNQPSPLKSGGAGGSGIVIIRYKFQ